MMQSQKRQQKTCWHCDGNISTEALYCPYCGSDVGAHSLGKSFSEPKETPLFPSQEGSQEKVNIASLYKPPYSPNHRGFGVPSFQESVPPATEEFYYTQTPHQTLYPQDQQEEKPQTPEAAQKTEAGLWPLLFLSIGMNLLTIGLLLFFFSDRGKLILEWNSYYWFVYCIFATPLLMFGWKLLQSNHYES